MEFNEGKFIVLEGIDGAGKTTQMRLLEKVSDPQKFFFTREASDGPIGQLLRYTYLAGIRKCDERVINMLYAADRLDHVTNSIDGMMKYLNKGIHVVSDRYYLSSMAYNTYMMPTREEIQEMIDHTVIMNRYVMDILRPDLTIYIDLDPGLALERLTAGREEVSVYETAEKLIKIYDTYRMAMKTLRERFHDKFLIVDGSMEPEEIHRVIYAHVMSLIKNN